jgi:hypothetical protein
LFQNIAGDTFEKYLLILLPFMVGQSHDSFTLLCVEKVMLFQHFSYPSFVHKVRTGGTLKQTWVPNNMFGVHE